jgi:hypothetical protein
MGRESAGELLGRLLDWREAERGISGSHYPHEAGMSNETNNSRVVVDPSLILTIEERDGDCRVVPPCAGSGGSDRDTYRRKIHQLDPVDSPRTLTSDWQPRTKWVGRFAAG